MRAAVASSVAIAIGIFVFTAAFGLTSSRVAAFAAAAVAAGVVAWRIGWRGFLTLDSAACPRALRILAAVATIAALVQLARLAVFHVEPARTVYSVVPSSEWEVRHSCVTAYYEAAALADAVPNVYDEALYSAPDDDPSRPRKARLIDRFRVDTYEYPPPFLLLPRALRLLAPDFASFRNLWFGLNGIFVLGVLILLMRVLGPAAGTRALLLSPLMWMALPTLSALQKGNFQVPAIAASMLAMVLFERRRDAAGGAVLAFVTVSKLFPGLLGVYLLARRQYRAAAWSAAFGVVFALAAWLDMGRAPYAAFLEHMPGLLSGESFPAFRNPAAMGINFSVPGLVFKLKLFGVPGMSFEAARIVGWIYTLVVTIVVWRVGRRAWSDAKAPLVWLAILILATLRSPFLPQAYAAFPPLLLLVLVGARRVPDSRRLAIVAVAWVALNIMWPLDWPLNPRAIALLNLVPQALTIALAVYTLRWVPGQESSRTRASAFTP